MGLLSFYRYRCILEGSMPYKIVRRTGARPWKIVNLDRNEVVGSSVTKKMAEASARARLAGEHGGLVRRKRR